MAKSQFLHFDALAHPVALENAGALLPLIDEVFDKWPHHVTELASEPAFITIRPGNDDKWQLLIADQPDAPRVWNSIDALCDLVAEVAWERIRSSADILCLHAAAVDFEGQLVVFPNSRRAGKSTMAVALAQLGHQIYTDDFLPLQYSPKHLRFEGIANGIYPRVRLPVPKDFGATFHDWVERDPGPSNKRYKFLTTCSIAEGGQSAPLGAIVVLDRTDEKCSPTLERLGADDALASLISQNFSRELPASAILSWSDQLTRGIPAFRLRYHMADDAAAFLLTHPDMQNLPPSQRLELPETSRAAPLGDAKVRPAPFAEVLAYRQAAGVHEVEVGDDHFLADGAGVAIHRLNTGSAIIWRLLSEQMTLEEVTMTLMDLFPNAAADQIGADTRSVMSRFVDSGLLVASSDVDL